MNIYKKCKSSELIKFSLKEIYTMIIVIKKKKEKIYSFEIPAYFNRQPAHDQPFPPGPKFTIKQRKSQSLPISLALSQLPRECCRIRRSTRPQPRWAET